MLLFATSLKSLHHIMSTKPHLLHEVVSKEHLGKVAVIVGTFSSERVQILTLKYSTYQIYDLCSCILSCSHFLN